MRLLARRRARPTPIKPGQIRERKMFGTTGSYLVLRPGETGTWWVQVIDSVGLPSGYRYSMGVRVLEAMTCR